MSIVHTIRSMYKDLRIYNK